MERFTDVNSIEPVSCLDDLIRRLKEVFEEDRVNVEYVKALMENYKSNPREWKKYAKFDPHRYTRNLVDEGNGKFNLMILCWNEGQGSSIHAHSGSHCFLKVLDGQMLEQLYDWPVADKSEHAQYDEEVREHDEHEGDENYTPMRKREQATYKRNSVTYINDSLGLHRMENPSNSEPSVTLHLYSPPFQQCYVYDERTARRITSTMTFWSKFGARTPFTVPLPSINNALTQAENN